jgi:hypothetical protein
MKCHLLTIRKLVVTMNVMRFSIAVLATWVFFTIGGAVWHEVLFDGLYTEWVFGIERLEMPILYFIINDIMRSIVYVYVYHMLYKGGNPVSKGLKFGFLMGILTGLSVTGYYGDFNITSPSWAVMEFGFNIIRSLVGGLIIALIIGKRKPGVEPL